MTIVEVDEAAIERGLKRIERGLEKAGGETAEVLARIAGSTDLETAAADADHVIESVIEVIEAKADVLRRLDAVCRDDVIFASNTSQFPISKLGAFTDEARPGDRQPLVQPAAADEADRGDPWRRDLGRDPRDDARARASSTARRRSSAARTRPGFVTSRLIASFMVEAARIVEEGIADIEDVDKACKLGFGHAMGPLLTADFSGLDTVERVADNLAANYGDRFLVPQMIRALVNAGHLGRKTGRGLRDYGEAR